MPLVIDYNPLQKKAVTLSLCLCVAALSHTRSPDDQFWNQHGGRRDARAVGLATTSTVVQGIVAVIVLDAAFAVVLQALGW